MKQARSTTAITDGSPRYEERVEEHASGSADYVKTCVLKSCCECSAALLDGDNFCRCCGVAQPVDMCVDDHIDHGLAHDDVTTAGSELVPYHQVSWPVVKAMLGGVRADPCAHAEGCAAHRLVQALIWLPIWLVIVLLSPLDAYSAAKSISKDA